MAEDMLIRGAPYNPDPRCGYATYGDEYRALMVRSIASPPSLEILAELVVLYAKLTPGSFAHFNIAGEIHYHEGSGQRDITVDYP